ncbi:hypothetical protein AK830_g3571 [Neonectria ditissima]|uniref:Uncharacterized protein n=1 Tax=Neonectria ditissima TaxID=78410 RepID=A0A0P7B8H7_9HYPO|nr:hypothetical protein AK830_g3571 [Neonectria ditissima]
MQFMSQSIGWADNFVLAMAPVGIITIIVSAIRVGGPSWLKAIIGRARENLAVPEAELMSSTSKEVCELWNGREIDTITAGMKPDAFPKVTVKTLEEAVKEGYLTDLDSHVDLDGISQHSSSHFSTCLPSSRHPSSIDSRAERGDNPASEIIIVGNKSGHAPNISLNCHSQLGRGELRGAAVIGSILQLGVLVYAGLATYYPVLKFPKGENPVAAYAFPSTAAGTLILAMGLLLCAHVVESSTTERRYLPKDDKEARLVWLQQTKIVNDQVFDSKAIFATDPRHLITMSYRANRRSSLTFLQVNIADTFLGLKTVIGTIISLFGFILQFIGLRGMHWSVSIAQLSAVLTMAGIKAVVRRGLAIPPKAESLTSNFELDWLATTLADLNNAPWLHTSSSKLPHKKDWGIVTGRDVTQEDLRQGLVPADLGTPLRAVSKAHGVMMLRRDLGELADWRGRASAEAITVARAIELTMDTLFDIAELRSDGLLWSLKAYGPESERIYFRTFRKKKGWKAYSDEIDAALSLWLYRAIEEEKDRLPTAELDKDDVWLRAKESPGKRSLRLLGSSTSSLRRDLCWWMPRGNAGIIEVAENDVESLGGEPTCVVGFGSGTFNHDLQSGSGRPSRSSPLRRPTYHAAHSQLNTANSMHIPGPVLAMWGDASLTSVYAQDMFAAFMRAVARTMANPLDWNAEIRPNGRELENTKSRDTAPDDTYDPKAWYSFTLENDQLSKLAQDIHSTGLGTLEEVYQCMIPALSREDKLPATEGIIEVARQHARRHEQSGRLDLAKNIYVQLFQMGRTFPAHGSFSMETTAILFELLRQVTLNIEVQKRLYGMGDYEALKGALEEQLKDDVSGILPDLMILYEGQGRAWTCGLSVPANPFKANFPKESNISSAHVDVLSDMRVFANDACLSTVDILGWTPLHYAAARGSTKIAVNLLEREVDVSPSDLLEWRPLHYACKAGHLQIVEALLHYHAHVNVQGRDGTAPLHCATMSGKLDVVNKLVEAGAVMDAQDASGTTPLLWAAYHGHEAIVENLWADTTKEMRDHKGQTALHIAAAVGGTQVSRLLSRKLGADKEARDLERVTPLQRAAMNGHVDVVKLLMEDGANQDAKSAKGGTLLHCAASNGRGAVVEFLIDTGADKEAKDQDERRPLHCAAMKGHETIISLLVQSGADKNSKDSKGMSSLYMAVWQEHEAAVKLLIQLGADKGTKNKQGWTLLHLAAVLENETMVSLFIEAGANVEARDCKGLMPLHMAAMSQNPLLVRLFLEAGANMHATDVEGRTPLHVAVTEAVASLLVEAGVDIEATDSRGRTPLQSAVWAGSMRVASLLITHGANIKTTDSQGKTPLHIAAHRGEKACASLLIEHGADREATDSAGQTPLHLAARLIKVDVAELLIKHGANIETTDSQGHTPLHLAARLRKASVAKLLIDRGADIEATDSEGRTPLHLAAMQKHKSAAELLIKHGADVKATNSQGKTPLDACRDLMAAANVEPVVGGYKRVYTNALRKRRIIEELLISEEAGGSRT